MASLGQNVMIDGPEGRTISAEANTGNPLKGDFERMSRRRFQNPKPVRRGSWWYILVRRDVFVNGKLVRKNTREKLALSSMPERQVLKIASEHLRDLNQGLENIGSATNFAHYVENTYMPITLCTMAKSTQARYRGVIKNYLMPGFGRLCLRDLTPMAVDRYFAGLAGNDLAQESLDKIRDVLASIITRAMRHGLLIKNPMEGVELPRGKRTQRSKPYITPEQFNALVELIQEPYASMVYLAIYTGLRVSELIGLKWGDLKAWEENNELGQSVRLASIRVDERCCRGDWDRPKSEASAATIGMNICVMERLERMKDITVSVKAGRAIRRYKLVKSDGPEDLVFQSVRSGSPMRDNNILSRFIKPAARTLGLDFVNWRCLRTSHATWLKMAGADVKDAQAQMRHSRASTTLDIYQQFVPASQRRAVDKLAELAPVTPRVQ
jgi:integrase